MAADHNSQEENMRGISKPILRINSEYIHLINTTINRQKTQFDDKLIDEMFFVYGYNWMQ